LQELRESGIVTVSGRTEPTDQKECHMMNLETGVKNFLGAAAIRWDQAGLPQLIGSHCLACDVRLSPPVSVCPNCASEKLETEEQPRTGVLYTFTVVRVGPATLSRPFGIGYVDLPNGVRVLAHLKGEGWRIDQPVVLDFANVGVDAEGRPIGAIVFRAAREHANAEGSA
jgi:uncharacterized OB-fold protein